MDGYEGFDCEALKEQDWSTFDWDQLNQEEVKSLEKPFFPFFMSHTRRALRRCYKEEYYSLSLATAKDTVKNQQLKAREYWTEINHPSCKPILLIRGIRQGVRHPLRNVQARALIENTTGVYEQELGFSSKNCWPKAARVI